MKRLLFIYNPRAGQELLKPGLSDIVDIFVKAGYEVVIYPTQSYRDAYRKVQECNTEEYDLVVCSGGDGTLDEVVTGMMMRSDRLPIGYIPTGTTNDFANSLHIPKQLLKAADNAVNGEVFPCDVGRFNDDIFVYIAAFGLFTDVSYETRQEAKNVLGHLAYVLEGTKRLFNVPSYRIRFTHDGESIEDEFIFGMVTNSRSVGGFKSIIGRKVQFDDGVFEVTFIQRPQNPVELQEILGAIILKEIDSKYMHSFRTSRLVVEADGEVPWTLDGEFGGECRSAVIQNHQKALEIRVEG